jgi:hypothetical protein
MRIVFFDDEPASFGRLSTPLGTLIGASAKVDRFDPGTIDARGPSRWPAPAIRTYLLKPRVTDLVVLDYDLTAYNPPVPTELVQKVCEEEGVPVCLYTFQSGPRKRAEYLLRWRDRAIALDLNQSRAKAASLVAAYAKGFARIRAVFEEDSGGEIAKLSNRILRPPEGASLRLEQYQWGGSVPLRLLQISRDSGKAKGARTRAIRFQTAAFGYWLVNDLLQFPGALLNEVAAASYLDISPDDFKGKPSVQLCFEKARYKGPFADVAAYWWTSKLDRILAEGASSDDNSVPTGFTYLSRKGESVSRCRCVEGHEGAGFYCVLTHQPVCAEHSVQPLAVFPVGANRSRIHRRAYRRLSPAVSM